MVLTHIKKIMNNPKINDHPPLLCGALFNTPPGSLLKIVVNGGRKVCHVASLSDE